MDKSELIHALEAWADELKPMWATASDYWYKNRPIGREQARKAMLLREAIERLYGEN